ncbi:phosphatidylinositol-glycan-specific phospholipase D-like [Mytilus californianus]|uniref:phosphatidylinositol-glycan-specific phospholipase D-like n=1 Tax=Mytilus californianus TaxID=6549 RepID=UPI0022472602|nr:phosphatidylinositol-glycan-specific phospholipase D-like [Mytilus californianus]
MSIGHRARSYFLGNGKTVDYQKLMNNHNDAFLAGSAFPDAFYSNLCKEGNYSQISEDTHWTPFITASVNYIRNKYQQPWNEATEKLVVFILGIMSHQVSDVVWHSLGIEQGFIPTLAAVDFHGNYSVAHEAADLGGDVISVWDMEVFDDLDPTQDWYVPTDDLFNIYQQYYSSVKIDKDTIDSCSTLIVLARRSEKQETRKNQDSNDPRTGIYAVNSSYAKLGWSLETGDMDGDGFEDLIIGAPGYSVQGSVQEGRVYIIYGNDSDSGGFDYYGINLDVNSRFNPIHDHITTIHGYHNKQSRFGSGLAVLDINLDGILDIAVGSPAYWIDSPLEYKGLISIYLGKKTRMYEEVDIVITCQSQYCNLGYNLESGDIDGDGHDDLIFGLPFYTDKYNQSGLVAAMMASKDVPVHKTVAFEDIKWRQILDKEVRTKAHESAGYSLDFGYLYDTATMILAVAFPGMTVEGSYLTLPVNLTRAGVVILYNMTGTTPVEVARFEGNSRYGGFGTLVMIEDVNGDGTDDLLIGEPSRNSNKAEIINDVDGLVYVYYGGKNFPKGDATRVHCGLTKPCPQKTVSTCILHIDC